MSRQRLFRLLLLFSLFVPLTAQAVTLGAVRVNSFLGQPLDAEIDLVGLSTGQHEDLRLRIANPEHFTRLGIVHDTILSDMRFDIVRSGERWLVRVRTNDSVIEPFLDFPLLMTWRNGQLVRQYTLLLDPPGRIQTARTTGSTARTPAPAAEQPERQLPTGGNYGRIQRGETLWPIAQQLKPAGITTRQMAVALLRANPDAFIDGNMNLLRAGAQLSIPPRSFVEQIDRATAHAEFAAQAGRHAGAAAQVATSPRAQPPKVIEPSGEDADSSTTEDSSKVNSADPSDTADARLQIVTDRLMADPTSENTQDLQEQLLVTMEEIESNRLTTDSIQARVDRLEIELMRMQQLLQLKDAQISALQSELSMREGSDKVAAGKAPLADEQVAEQASTTTTLPVTAPSAEPNKAPAEVARIETGAVPSADATDAGQAWYERYLWAIWAILAFLGMIALLLAFRRPNTAADELPMPDLPEAQSAAAPDDVPVAETALSSQAARSMHTPLDDAPPAAEPMRDRDNGRAATDPDIDDGITDTLLNDMLEESELLAEEPKRSDADSEINDTDITSWITEMGSKAPQAQSMDAKGSAQTDDEDIPSILTELDDQLSSAAPAELSPSSSVQLDPVDDEGEDETFAMSLDLARAYLEIGDQEGARDMLEQALSVAHNPDHRRQIEELLQQID